MSEVVPEGWKNVDFREISLPKAKKSTLNDQYLPLTSSRKGLVLQSEYFNKQVTSADNTGYKVISPGDFTFRAMSDDGTFKFNRSKFAFEGIVSPAYEVFEARNCNAEFLSYILDGDEFSKKIYAGAQGGTRLALKYSTLSDLKVSLPPLPEQKKIASILTSVDEVIEATQKQIDKLQDLKKATMNELLTKGIGHTEFKDSELGRIPKSWEVKKLDDVTIRGSGHTPDKKIPNYWNGGIKWVSLADSSNLDTRLIVSTDKEISAEGIKNSSAVLHPDGTVIVSRDAGIGKSAVLMGEMAVSQHFMAWRCGDKMEKWFLYYLLQSLKPLFDMVAIGSTIKTIGLGFFKKMQIVYPPIDEQRKISSIMLTIEDHIDEMKRKLTQTQSLKKSLMQDLLTGKVRVKVD